MWQIFLENYDAFIDFKMRHVKKHEKQ